MKVNEKHASRQNTSPDIVHAQVHARPHISFDGRKSLREITDVADDDNCYKFIAV